MNKELLRVLKGFLGAKSNIPNKKALEYGLLIPESASDEVVSEAISQYGKDGYLWNQTFHKSWDKVANAPMMQLIMEQIIHYFTTYGFESLGVYSEDSVYIPAEELNVPNLDISKIKLIPIVALTEQEVTDKIMALLTSGIALSFQTVADIKVLSDFVDKTQFDNIKNREVRIFLYDKYNIMPRDPETFLRFLIFKTTGETLKIQNEYLINRLKISDRRLVLSMLESYNNNAALASIFLRNKNLFLALKTDSKRNKSAAMVNTIINRIRKLADKYHKPLQTNVLDRLTSSCYTEEEVISALEHVTLFRAIRALNALAYYLNGNESVVYRIRNGKSYVSKTNDRLNNQEAMKMAYRVIKSYVAKKISPKLTGKFVYIPEGVCYKAPTSEKQFICSVPEGSYIEIPRGDDLIFAIHWYNLEGDQCGDDYYSRRSRVDLDMHMMNNSQQFGWNSNYRDDESKVLFSGDVTDAPAPKGATEAYSISHTLKNQSYLVTLNNFTQQYCEVPFEFIIAKGTVTPGSGAKCVIDPNNIIVKFNMKFNAGESQLTLGSVKADESTVKFCINNYAVGVRGPVSRRDEFTLGALNYMNTYNAVQTNLADLLTEAGAIIIRSPVVPVRCAFQDVVDGVLRTSETCRYDEIHADIDLSPESITKNSIIELFSK